MQRGLNTKTTGKTPEFDGLTEQGRAAIQALVKQLARQAAEKDFEALVKLQEAANDND
ncbi:MAG: hypothetical protein AAFY42_13890 [Pseudomonadota bacterium]